MARKPTRKPSASPARPVSNGNKSDRERVMDAFMALLAEKPIDDIGFVEIAEAAGVTLSELRNLFSSKVAILAAHMKEIDRAVLAGGDADMAEEPPRERLFDVLMRRLEALAPYKEAVHSLARSAMRNPGLAIVLNGLAVRSQQWMLSAAGITVSGPKGMMRAQGLALLFAQVLRTWVKDDDPGLARTLAALDRALARGQGWSSLLDNVCAIPACLSRVRAGRRRRNRGDDEETIAA
jgi:AcrR family transcriptional regulator